jgi:hypothetical protein
MIQGECEKCEDRGESHGPDCLVRKLIFNQHEPTQRKNNKPAMEAAVLALQNFLSRAIEDDMDCQIIPFASIKTEMRGKKMSVLSAEKPAISNQGIDLEKLKEPFEEWEIEFRLSQCGETKDIKSVWAKCLAYIDSRAIMDRLDHVCGAGNWRVSYEFVGQTGVICNLSILVNGEWITKQDGAEMTEIEPFKGGISGALKRAGNAWGIGRYLYSLEAEFIPKDLISDFQFEGSYYGKTKSGKQFYWAPPKLPSWALPAGKGTAALNPTPKKVEYATKDQIVGLFKFGTEKGLVTEDIKGLLMKLYKLDSTKDLTIAQYNGLKSAIEKEPKKLPWEKHLPKEIVK